MTAEELKALLDGLVLDDAAEMLDHSPWVVLRWFTKESVTTMQPEAHGPFVTPAEAFACADTIRHQRIDAERRNVMAREHAATYGEQVIQIIPMYADYDA